ncbi:MAG TPA: TonB family protein [Methylophilus sp.]|uniref:TonB family protein n=1 Tax=Methylophilus sp. TaxID=29541 RepID=UPI002C7E369B|nr:TonB family protein [Methylophilus sp.]HSH86643.1 TonB family protein [Methylophilus sp.]
MTSLVFIDDDSHAKVWRAVIISLAIHAVVVAIYPQLNKVRLPEIPERLEIEFFTMKAAAPSQNQAVSPPVEAVKPPEPQVTPKPPTPVTQTPKQVLAAPTNNDAEYHVPEPVAPTKAEPTPPAPAQTSPSTSAANNESRQSEEQTTKEAKPATATNTPVTSESDELTANDSDAWGDYGEQLRSLVNKSKQYPTIAIRRHLEGDVTIVAQFTRGELTQVSLAETSKHVPLDEEAMRMVKKAIQQLGVKESLKKKTFKITIPVSFRLE